MKYEIGDIVRIKHEHEMYGLFEITGESANGEVTITHNECNSEFYADEDILIFVCSVKDRKDI